MKRILLYTILIISVFVSKQVFGQADTLMKVCTQYMSLPFVSDGQDHKALLNGEELAEFDVTFYGGSTYRIVGCSGFSEGNLLFTLYDKERNVLFTNKEYENAPYWDFKFSSTVDCKVEAELDSKNLTSGFAILLIGFKQ